MTSVENKENASEVETIIIDDKPTAKIQKISTFFSPPRKKVKQDVSSPFLKLSKEDALRETEKEIQILNAKAKEKVKQDVKSPFPKLSKEDALREAEKEIQILNEKAKDKVKQDDILPFPKLSKEDALKESEKEIQILNAKVKENEKDLANDINGHVDNVTNIKNNDNVATPTPKKSPSTDDKKTSPLSKEERQRIKEEKEMQKAARMKEAEEKRKKREEEKVLKQAEKEKREQEKKEKDRLREEEKRKKEDEKEKREQERKEKEMLKEEEKLQKVKKEEQLRIEKEKKDAEKEKKELERKLKDETKKLEEEKKKQADEEMKKKKEKEASHFRSFFTKKKKGGVESTKVPVVESYERFKPFQVKPDMMLAPLVRNKNISRDVLDNVMENEIPDMTTYLSEQAKQYAQIGRPKYISRRKKRRDLEEERKLQAAKKTEAQRKERSVKPVENNKIDIENIVIINDDSNDVDNDDTEDEADLSICDKKYLYVAKHLKFSENTRPGYYGTWRKKSVHISGRKPFGLDKDVFNYDIDSDEEWIDVPGESLSDADEDENKEDEEKETEDDHDGFFVPHGYLSDDEGIGDEANEEDENSEKTLNGGADLNEDRKLKLKACSFEQDFIQQKQKHRKAICVGITYTQNVENINPVLRNYAKVALVKPVQEKEVEEEKEDEEMDSSSPRSTDKSPQQRPMRVNGSNIPMTVPEEAMPLLIRFVHGNVSSLLNMIQKFREYWTMYVKENGGTMRADISKRQLERKIQTIASRVSNSEIGKMCYVVNDDVIKMYNLNDLKIGEGIPELKPNDNSSQNEPQNTSMEID